MVVTQPYLRYAAQYPSPYRHCSSHIRRRRWREDGFICGYRIRYGDVPGFRRENVLLRGL